MVLSFGSLSLKNCEGRGGERQGLQSRGESILSGITASGLNPRNIKGEDRQPDVPLLVKTDALVAVPIYDFDHVNWLFTCPSNHFLFFLSMQLEYFSQPHLQLVGGDKTELKTADYRGDVCHSLRSDQFINTFRAVLHRKLLLSPCQYPGGPRQGHNLHGRTSVSLSP